MIIGGLILIIGALVSAALAFIWVAFKLENGLLKLVQSLEQKQTTGDWVDSLIIKEGNVAYG